MEFKTGVLLNTFIFELGLFLSYLLRYKKISYAIIFYLKIHE